MPAPTHLLPRGFLPILSPEMCGDVPVFAILEAFAEAEIPLFILREPKWPKARLQNLLSEITELTHSLELEVIVHQHVDLACSAQALGVHLNKNSHDIQQARKILGANYLIGYSAHSLAEAQSAEQQGADYILLGAIFPTPKAHANHPVLGITNLAQTATALKIPVYGIGGINDENLLSLRSTGARGFTALRALYQSDNPEHQILKWQILWEET